MMVTIIFIIIYIILLALLYFVYNTARSNNVALEAIVNRFIEQNQNFFNMHNKMLKDSKQTIEMMAKQLKEVYNLKQYVQTIKDSAESVNEISRVNKMLEANVKKYNSGLIQLNILIDRLEKLNKKV